MKINYLIFKIKSKGCFRKNVVKNVVKNAVKNAVKNVKKNVKICIISSSMLLATTAIFII